MNVDKLKGHIPDSIIAEIPSVSDKFGVNTGLRLAHFLAQTGHESGGFKVFSENLNYGAKGLVGIFGKYFTAESATAYERKPEKIANIVYANRMGNGNQASGEGYKFRGRGAIQLTGKDNYAAFDKTVDDDILANPDLVATKYPLLSAAWFWNSRNLNSYADRGNITKVSELVNGKPVNHLQNRIDLYNHALSVL